MNDRILITGIGGPAGRSAVTYFKEKGFFIIGTDVRDVDVKVDIFHKMPMAVDAGFSSVLLDIIAKDGPFLFIPTVSEELPRVSRLKGEIEKLGCSIFISPPDAVDIANDKLMTAIFMSQNGVPAPKTFDGSAPRETVIKELGLPLLSKPCVGRGGRGVVLYMSKEDLYNETREGIIFQEFIPGEEFDVNLFIGKGGDVLSAVALRKTLLKDGLVGNAVDVERDMRDDVIDLAKKAAGSLKMEGPLDFDVRLRRDGRPALLEINARLGGNVLHAREILDCFLNSLKRNNY